MAAEQDIYGHWRRALTNALERMTDHPELVSAAEEVKQIRLEDGREAIIFVKVIEYREAEMLLHPVSGGLAAGV